jgi:hypothetical protein
MGATADTQGITPAARAAPARRACSLWSPIYLVIRKYLADAARWRPGCRHCDSVGTCPERRRGAANRICHHHRLEARAEVPEAKWGARR